MVPVGHALEHVLKIGEGLDAVKPGQGDEGADSCPAVGAAIGAGMWRGVARQNAPSSALPTLAERRRTRAPTNPNRLRIIGGMRLLYTEPNRLSRVRFLAGLADIA